MTASKSKKDRHKEDNGSILEKIKQDNIEALSDCQVYSVAIVMFMSAERFLYFIVYSVIDERQHQEWHNGHSGFHSFICSPYAFHHKQMRRPMKLVKCEICQKEKALPYLGYNARSSMYKPLCDDCMIREVKKTLRRLSN